MDQNYSETIKQHYRHPLNAGRLSHPTHTAEAINPLCGDETKVYLQIEDGIIKNIRHETRGCMICVAAASVVSEYARDKKLSRIKNFGTEKISALLDVAISPTRERCALLIASAINSASV